MIYSPDHNFLLLKGLKVGSTSTEIVLSRVVPENAIVTPIKPYHVEHRPRNYAGFENRMSYSEINKKINLSNVKAYIGIRNPYEVVLSRFFHTLVLKQINWNSINENEKNNYLDIFFKENFMKSTKNLFLSNNLEIQVESFIRYENGIEDETNKILKIHEIPEIKINQYEKAHRPKGIHYPDVFKKEHLDKIQEEWAWEFDHLGYNR
jgi:hypothetical protein